MVESTNEPEDSEPDSDESEYESGNLVSSLSVDFDHIVVTPPPSPPEPTISRTRTPQSEKADANVYP